MYSARQIFLTVVVAGALLCFLAFQMTRSLDDRSIMRDQERLTQHTRDILANALELT